MSDKWRISIEYFDSHGEHQSSVREDRTLSHALGSALDSMAHFIDGHVIEHIAGLIVDGWFDIGNNHPASEQYTEHVDSCAKLLTAIESARSKDST